MCRDTQWELKNSLGELVLFYRVGPGDKSQVSQHIHPSGPSIIREKFKCTTQYVLHMRAHACTPVSR